MNLNILVFFTLTTILTMHLSSSDRNSQKGPTFKATISQQNADNNPQITSQKAPLTKNSSPGDLECNITPEPYRISSEKLLKLERKLNEEIRKNSSYNYQNPYFEEVYVEERRRFGSPDIMLINHDQSCLTRKPSFNNRPTKWRDLSSKPTNPLTVSTKEKFPKDDILNFEASREDAIEEDAIQ